MRYDHDQITYRDLGSRGKQRYGYWLNVAVHNSIIYFGAHYGRESKMTDFS